MIKNFLDSGDQGHEDTENARVGRKPHPEVISLFDSAGENESDRLDDKPFILSAAPPESSAETTRKSGLAWSAGIAFFASVVFMLVLGWGADLLLGTSPWGMVGGIVLGSLIGFIQFFRLTSQIFK